jgi:predicted alpha/beta superfamily hydrolase
VLVGIPLNDKYLDFAPVFTGYPGSGHADTMLQFFSQELFPLLESEFRCSRERIIWAHSALAGIFCTYLLLGPDRQFSGILASSPNLRFMEKDYLSSDNVFEELEKKGKLFYYLTFGGNEAEIYMDEMAPRVGAFADRLEQEAPSNLIWEYRYNDNNTHFTNAIETYMEGLSTYFREMHD